MRTQDIVIGETYRLRRSPNYGYVKAIQLLKANDTENEFRCTVVKCEHTVNENDTFGLIKYFRPVDMAKKQNSKKFM